MDWGESNISDDDTLLCKVINFLYLFFESILNFFDKKLFQKALKFKDLNEGFV